MSGTSGLFVTPAPEGPDACLDSRFQGRQHSRGAPPHTRFKKKILKTLVKQANKQTSVSVVCLSALCVGFCIGEGKKHHISK